MKKCDKIRDLFGAYIHNDVTPIERADVAEHIKSCEICADDLESRQKVMTKLKPAPQLNAVPLTTQADFASNVYRRIALNAMQRQTRHVFRQRFILRPAFAVLVLTAVLTIAVIRFHPGDHIVQKLPSVAEADETIQKKLRANLHVTEFFRGQGIIQRSESGYVSVGSASTAEPLSPDMGHFAQNTVLPDSRRRLREANLINYSLGDRGRALAEYQQLVDYYPDTDAATEARERIKAIQGTGSSTQPENFRAERLADSGI